MGINKRWFAPDRQTASGMRRFTRLLLLECLAAGIMGLEIGEVRLF